MCALFYGICLDLYTLNDFVRGYFYADMEAKI